MTAVIHAMYHRPLDTWRSSGNDCDRPWEETAFLIVQNNGKTHDGKYVIPVEDPDRPYKQPLVAKVPALSDTFKLGYRDKDSFRFMDMTGWYAVLRMRAVANDVLEQVLRSFAAENDVFVRDQKRVEHRYTRARMQVQKAHQRALDKIKPPIALEHRLSALLLET